MSGQLSAGACEVGYAFDTPFWRAGHIRINLTQLSDGLRTMAKKPGPTPSLSRLTCVDLQHLRFAVIAVEYGSFRQTAEILGVRQSTLSRSIRQLEHLIGVVIFDRSSGGVKPTSAGRSVLRMARTILEEFETLIATARSVRNGQHVGRLDPDPDDPGQQMDHGMRAAVWRCLLEPSQPRRLNRLLCSISGRDFRRSNLLRSSEGVHAWQPDFVMVCSMF